MVYSVGLKEINEPFLLTIFYLFYLIIAEKTV